MANLEQYGKLTRQERQYRYFSDEFKKKKVSEIERGLVSVSEVGRQYQVTCAAIYKWIYKYSMTRKKGERQIVEIKSDTLKIKLLKEQIEQLEKLVGQKQIQIDFLEKMMEVAKEEYGIDIKKKHSTPRLPGFGKSVKSTSIK